jgi:uncharacterized protein YjbI with pentapeptide repeats
MAADDYRHKFAEFLSTQPVGGDLSYERIVRAQTRQELGISSLNMIMVLLNYIKKYTNGGITVRPEWVLRLNDVDGIISVLREIDASEVDASEADASEADASEADASDADASEVDACRVEPARS